MKVFEIAVAMKVRRIMRVRAPSAALAPAVAEGFITLAAEGLGDLSSILIWTDGREAYRPMPAETVLLDPPPEFGEPIEVRTLAD